MNYLEKELLSFDGHGWRIRDAVQGTMCFGATGSGKTSGPLRKIALAMLESGFGGIVLCCKSEEAADWEKYAQESYRSDDIIRLSELTFNFLDYERTREGAGAGQIENIVNIFTEVCEVGKKKKDSAANEEYFRNAVAQLLRNAITLLIFGDETISIQRIKQIVDTCPKTPQMSVVGKGYCCELCERISEDSNKSGNPEFELANTFFRKEFPSHDPKTRANVMSSFTVIADALLRGELRRCFCPDKDSTFRPEDIIAGKILIVDYSVKEWGKLGSYASAIIKFCFQKSVERRKDMGSPDMRPVFIFADECQEFAIRYDRVFLSTARSAGVANIFATQNVGNLYSVYGKEDAAAILGNLQTKIICQNGDEQTNEWAAKSIGKHITRLKNESSSTSKNWSRGAQRSGNASSSEGWREQKDYIVDPVEFTRFKTGGILNLCTVDFILWQPGRLFSENTTHLKTSIKQQCRLSCGRKSEYSCDSFHIPKVPKLHFGSLSGMFWISLMLSIGCSLLGYWGISIAGTLSDFIVLNLPMEKFVTFSAILIYGFCPAYWYLLELLCVIFFHSSSTAKYNLGIAGDLYFLYSIYPAYLVYTAVLNGFAVTSTLLYWLLVATIAKLIFLAEQHVSPNKK